MGLMIETFDLTRKFANLTAVEDLSIQVRKGEILGFLGPNGAGKTTTIKIMVGLLSEFEGTLRIGGHPMPGRRDQVHKMLGYLPQDVAFQVFLDDKSENSDSALFQGPVLLDTLIDEGYAVYDNVDFGD